MTLTLESLAAEADRCVACGLCLPHCPTYRKTGSEADSPRGRIQLMRAVSQNILPNNARFKAHIDQCLSCRSCESACPNSVAYGSLLDATRALHLRNPSRWYRLSKPFIRHPALQKMVHRALWHAQQLKLTSLLKRVLPAARILPVLTPPAAWKSFYPAAPDKQGIAAKGAVSLFLGCASNTFDQATLQASIYVLNALGYDVHIPTQSCCGSIARQMGDHAEAQKLISINTTAFEAGRPILTVASGCGAGLKDYLRSHQVHDISAFLMSCDWTSVTLAPLSTPIFVQDPCSLRNVQKSQLPVYALLQKIPQSKVTPLAGNAQCCGGAGAYMLTQTEMADRLLQDKLDAIESIDAALLATSNIGCSLHIAQGLRARRLHVDIMHPVQIIAGQMGHVAS